jgi:uncharacterized membrane protein (DUF106 family)
MNPATLVFLDLTFLNQPPYATYAIMFLALGVGLVSNIIGTRSMDVEAYKRLQIESHKVRKELMDATKSGNQRRIDKAQKKQQDLMSQQSKISMDRMRSSMLFTLPLLLFWGTLRNFFGTNTIAYFPFNFPYIPREFGFFNWYLLCSFAFNVILNRIFGMSFEIEPDEE